MMEMMEVEKEEAAACPLIPPKTASCFGPFHFAVPGDFISHHLEEEEENKV